MRKLSTLRAPLGLAAVAAVVAGAAASGSISSAIGATPDNVVVRYSADVTVPSAGPINRQATAYCMSWEKVTGGGAAVTGIPGGSGRGEYFTSIVRDRPLPESLSNGQTATGWQAEATNNSAHLAPQGGENSVLRAYVMCAS
jgi:hypothetical protein